MIRSSLTSSLCIFICFQGLLGFTKAQWGVDDSGCRTPDRGTGNCVPVKNCQPMVDVLLKLTPPYPPGVGKRLGAYRCGAGAEGVKVCCPQGPIVFDKNAAPIEYHLRSEPPDITNHRNMQLLPQTCGYLDTSIRIVNGEHAHLNEFPWMALLQYNTPRGNAFLCGGTIIHQNYILTAAHCLSQLKTDQKLIGVRVGEHSIQNETDCEIQEKNKPPKCNPPVQNLNIEEIIPHPQFVRTERSIVNDIGLIRVSTINLNVENARPVCLPIGTIRDITFRNVIVAGWGVTNSFTGQKADVLQRVGIPVADKDSCSRTYSDHNLGLTNTQICAGGASEKDSCGGDSGGPMMVPTVLDEDNFIYVQQGIVSFGPKFCGEVRIPGVYTLVKFYMDWILDSIRP